MGQLYSFENGVLVPYSISRLSNPIQPSAALGYGAQQYGTVDNPVLPSPAQVNGAMSQNMQYGTAQITAPQNSVGGAMPAQRQSTQDMYNTQIANTTQQQQNSAGSTVEQNPVDSNRAGQTQDKAWQELYMKAMADLEAQRQINTTMQVELAKNAIIGRANQEATIDLDGALDKFFGYTE